VDGSEPAKRYNMVLIGAGTAGFVTRRAPPFSARKSRSSSATLMGGDCLNFR
jgi:hypothetical protein